MKKITKYLIIPLFSLFAFFLLFNTNVSAEMSGGVVVDPGDSSGDISVNPPISGEELFQTCHDYITTNIISAESLTEALNGKIYSTFTQEDCMEMINIASKREVIKNELNIVDVNEITKNGITYSFIDNVLTVNGTSTNGFGIVFFLSETLVLNETYTFSKTSNSNLITGTYFTLWNDGDTNLQINVFSNTDTK